MQKIFSTIFILLYCVQFILAQTQRGQNVYGLPGDRLGFSVAISDQGNRIAAGGNLHDGIGDNSGYVLVFDLLGDSLVRVGEPIEGVEAGDLCGTAVALSAWGNRIVIGSELARFETIKPGSVRVFDWTGDKWTQTGATIFGETHQHRFGEAVDITADGKRIIIGTHGNNLGGTSGSVSIYEELSGEWQQVGQIIRGAPGEQIGLSVSISSDGNRIAFGRNQTNPDELGFIRVYELNNSMWQQVGTDIVGESPGGWTGASVSLSADGKRVSFGAPLHEEPGTLSGRVYVYEEISGNWFPLGNPIDGNGAQGYFGVKLSLSGNGDRLAVGAPFSKKGTITLYQLKDNTWGPFGEPITDNLTNDYFGDAVALSSDGKRLVGGGWFNDTPGVNSGLVQLYTVPRIVGNIFHDISAECTKDASDQPLPERFANIEPGSILVKSDMRGTYSLDSLPPGQYSITFDTSGPWIPVCDVVQQFVIPATDTIIEAPSMGFITSFPCTRPQISIIMPSIRRCFDNQRIFVQVCNEDLATDTISNPYVLMRMDPHITPLSANVPYEYLGNLQYRFDVGTLRPGECELFSITSLISCDAQLGQTLCIESALFPSDTCRDIYASLYHPSTAIPCHQAYDGSDLAVAVNCTGDSLRFIIRNLALAGEGDMVCSTQVRIYRDELLIHIDSVKLAGQEIKEISIYADGYTWRIEADQHPMYAGWSRPSASIELCGDAQNWTAGLINNFNLNDLDPAFDIFCDLVTGSFDPNDKSAYPIGIGPEHAILPNQQIEYLIRFQNTGTDTAFNVVIRDTLDKNFDLFSIVRGPSSHPDIFHIVSPGILEWSFPNIQLPDSNANEALSHGFVSYTVRQKFNLPEGQVLKNSAAIYFDYNDPVITNTVYHTVQENRLISAAPRQPDAEQQDNYHVYPNPTTGKFEIDVNPTMHINEIEIFNIQGDLLHMQQNYNNGKIEVNPNLQSGIYFLKINTREHFFKVVKLVVVK